jgi:RNA polymerase sigma factor (sigma-70 family)
MPGRARPSAAYILAVLSRVSSRRGDAAVARARLIECLGLLHSAGSERSGAVALEAAAELAQSTGDPERAVEFYGARERLLRRRRVRDEEREAENRIQLLDRLRAELGDQRYETAWKTSRGTPFPFEFYVSAALHWLESLDPHQLGRADATSPVPEMATEPQDAGTTAQLIADARNGSTRAKEKLVERHLGPLRRIAHGQIPNHARSMVDTDDLVQTTMIRGLDKLNVIQPRRKGGFLAYLRRILVNQARDEMRRLQRKPQPSALFDSIPSELPSPLDAILERETFDAYESALRKLPPRQREAVALRIDRGCSFQEVADSIGCPSANAARMLVSRGLARVTKTMRR